MLREAKLAKKKANRVDYYAVSDAGRWARLTGKGCGQAGNPAPCWAGQVCSCADICFCPGDAGAGCVSGCG